MNAAISEDSKFCIKASVLSLRKLKRVLWRVRRVETRDLSIKGGQDGRDTRVEVVGVTGSAGRYIYIYVHDQLERLVASRQEEGGKGNGGDAQATMARGMQLYNARIFQHQHQRAYRYDAHMRVASDESVRISSRTLHLAAPSNLRFFC